MSLVEWNHKNRSLLENLLVETLGWEIIGISDFREIYEYISVSYSETKNDGGVTSIDLDKNLKETIRAIIDYTETLPEIYREKAFSLLLKMYIDTGYAEIPEREGDLEDVDSTITINQELLAILRRFDISKKDLSKLFTNIDDKLVPLYHYPVNEKSDVDTYADMACLLSLENAIVDGTLKFDKDNLRLVLQKEGVYESDYFMNYLRRRSKFFVDLDGEEVHLSNKGRKHLADLIAQFVSAVSKS